MSARTGLVPEGSEHINANGGGGTERRTLKASSYCYSNPQKFNRPDYIQGPLWNCTVAGAATAETRGLEGAEFKSENQVRAQKPTLVNGLASDTGK
ncbi:hypothetical protein TWF281_007862 [Arthrobotrys megalospora]